MPNTSQLEGHIYLVEDNADIRRHLTMALLRHGLTVAEFNNAEDFLKHATKQFPAVVLLDMALPGVNGVAAFSALRKNGWTTPVVFISGQSEPTEIIEAMKMGANNFLWKPFATSDLIDAIRKALDTDKQQMHHREVAQQRADLWSSMTDREQQICGFMLNGMGNTEIAKRLDVMPDTIKKHRARIFEKFAATSLSDLIETFRGFQPPKQ